MKPPVEIPVTGSDRPALVSHQDACLAGYSWRLDPTGYPVRDVTVYEFGDRRHNHVVHLAREVSGVPAGRKVYRDNGDPLDCRRENLYVTSGKKRSYYVPRGAPVVDVVAAAKRVMGES